jgi:ATP-dependent protease ClpP protease subunit
MAEEERFNENTKVITDGNIKTKQIYIIGEINEERSQDVIKSIFETDWKGEGINNLSIYISSEGGFLIDCFAMIDAIQFVRDSFDVHISTFGLGECTSAGFFLFLLGDLRVIFPSCKIYVHEHISMLGESSYDDTKREIKDQKMVYDMYVEYTSKQLGISKARVKTLLKKNRYLTQKELEKFNIITKIDESNETKE